MCVLGVVLRFSTVVCYPPCYFLRLGVVDISGGVTVKYWSSSGHIYNKQESFHGLWLVGVVARCGENCNTHIKQTTPYGINKLAKFHDISVSKILIFRHPQKTSGNGWTRLASYHFRPAETYSCWRTRLVSTYLDTNIDSSVNIRSSGNNQHIFIVLRLSSPLTNNTVPLHPYIMILNITWF